MFNIFSSKRTTAVSLAPHHQKGGTAPYWTHWELEMARSLELVLLTIVSSSKGRQPPPGSSTGVLNLWPP